MIGKTFKRLLPVSALALAASAAMNAGNAQAILVYEFLEEGADVRLNISGSLTLPSPPAFDSFTSTTTSIRTGGSSFKIAANPLGGAIRQYDISGPATIGTSSSDVSLSNYIGSDLYMNRFSLNLPDGYVSGNSITGTGLLVGQTLNSLGLNSTTPGALLGTWTINDSTDSIEVRIGSGAAAVPGPLPLLGAAAAFAHSRRLRARLRASSSPQA